MCGKSKKHSWGILPTGGVFVAQKSSIAGVVPQGGRETLSEEGIDGSFARVGSDFVVGVFCS